MVETLEGDIWTFGGSPENEHAGFFVQGLADLVYEVWAGSEIEWRCPIHLSCNISIRDDDCNVHPWQKGQLAATCGYGAAAKLLHVAGRTFGMA